MVYRNGRTSGSRALSNYFIGTRMDHFRALHSGADPTGDKMLGCGVHSRTLFRQLQNDSKVTWNVGKSRTVDSDRAQQSGR